MTLRKPGGACGACAAAFMLVAGLAAPARAALSYDVSLSAGVRLNDNLHLDPEPTGADTQRAPVEETIFTIDPAARVSWAEQDDRLDLRYRGEYLTFQGDEDRDPFWIHNLAAVLTWRRWSPFFLEVREDRDRVPRSQEREGVAVVDQIDRNQVSVRTGLFWSLSPTCVAELAYRGASEVFPGTEDADRMLSHRGESLLRYRWSPLWEGELRLAYGEVVRDLTPDSAEIRASAAVDRRVSERLLLRYRLEWVRDSADQPAAAAGTPPGETGATVSSSLLHEALVTRSLERGGSWRLAYLNELGYLPDGDTLLTGRASAGVTVRARLGSALSVSGWHETRDYRQSGREETAWGPIVSLQWVLTPWAGASFGGSWTRTAIREEGQERVEDSTTQAETGLVVSVLRNLQLAAGYGFSKNDSTDALRSYKNNVLYARLSCRFGSGAPGGLW